MRKYCLTLDLKPDPELIAGYEKYHTNVWPEIIESIRDSGILRMDIFRYDNRLCMIMETTDEFSFEKKSEADAANAKVQDWEELMWKYQQALPGAKPGEKWMLMKNIFSFDSYSLGFRV